MNVLDREVLVVNSRWQWCGMTTVREAFKKVSGGSIGNQKAVFVDVNFIQHDLASWLERPIGDEYVQTSRRKLAVPAVIRVINYSEMPQHAIKWGRIRVLKRDKLICQYCGVQKPMSELTLDHVLPVSRGGKSAWDNTVAACEACNARKADRLPNEAGMRLKRPPVAPYSSMKERLEACADVHESWRHFVDG